eukprot:CFRG4800T1
MSLESDGDVALKLLDLFVDLRQEILSYLARDDIANVALSCKILHADLDPRVLCEILCHGKKFCSGVHQSIHGGLQTCVYAKALIPGCAKNKSAPLRVFVQMLKYAKKDSDSAFISRKKAAEEGEESYSCLNVIFGGVCKTGLIDIAAYILNDKTVHKERYRNSGKDICDSVESDRVQFDVDPGCNNNYALQWAVRRCDVDLVKFLCNQPTVIPVKDAMEYAAVYKNKDIMKLLKKLRMSARHRANLQKNSG